MKPWHKISVSLFSVLVLMAGLAAGLDAADRAYPPPLETAALVSSEVVDSDGQLLRAFATREGRWRLKTNLGDVDPRLVEMLVAYEDQRFFQHSGVDILAMGRAALQLVGSGRVVSGASTLSMQVARLIEPRPARSLSARTASTALVAIIATSSHSSWLTWTKCPILCARSSLIVGSPSAIGLARCPR